jgi:hypothetical protein
VGARSGEELRKAFTAETRSESCGGRARRSCAARVRHSLCNPISTPSGLP